MLLCLGATGWLGRPTVVDPGNERRCARPPRWTILVVQIKNRTARKRNSDWVSPEMTLRMVRFSGWIVRSFSLNVGICAWQRKRCRWEDYVIHGRKVHGPGAKPRCPAISSG